MISKPTLSNRLIAGNWLARDGGGNRPAAGVAGVADRAEQERAGQAFPPVVVVDADVEQLQHARVVPVGGGQGGDRHAVVLGQQRQPLLHARHELAVDERRLAAQRVGLAQRLTQRPLFQPPPDVEVFAVARQVQVAVAVAGGVDLGEVVDVGGPEGAQLHARTLRPPPYDDGMTQPRDEFNPDGDGGTALLDVPPDDRRPASIDLPPPPEESAPASAFAEHVEEVPAADAAEVLGDLEPEKATDVCGRLEPATAAEVLAEMDYVAAGKVLASLAPERAAAILHEMDPDDRVDVLDEVDEDVHDAIVASLSEADRENVLRLEQYPPDTAGGRMTTRVTRLWERLSVGQAIDQLRREADELEQMFYSYVIDRRGHLVGVLSMRDLILSKPSRPLHEVMRTEVRALPADMDQEEVAELFSKYNYLAMPVVDTRNRLIGLITVDDIVDVLEEEATEDVQVLFGAGAEERLSSPWTVSFKSRVGWLIVNLGTAFAAGAVVAAFSGIIDRVAVLAAFMPIVAGMGGNASAQAMAVAVRGLSGGEPIEGKVLRHVLKRELYVGLLTGLIIGTITGAIALAYEWRGGGVSVAVTLALVVFLALLINHALACVSGAGIPFVLKKLGFDPAQSATIFATTVTDVVGFFALLGLAYLAIDRLAPATG